MKQFILCIALSLICQTASAIDVIVNKAAPAVTRKTFDPSKPDDPHPHLGENEIAKTEYIFRIEMDLQPIPGTPAPVPGGGVKAAIRLNQVRVRLAMPVTVWLPKGATDQVKTHEEGHLQIAQLFYKEADKMAKDFANLMIGKAYEGEGKDANAAYNAAAQKAAQELNEKYIAAISTPCDEVQKIYDQITDFSRNTDLKPDKAVTQAMDTWKEQQKKQKEKK